MRTARMLAALALVVLSTLGMAAAASAHVTADPSTAPKGAGDQEFTFRVPNEEDKASTVEVELQLDQAHPIAAVDVAAMPGWTTTVTTRHLTTPIKTDDGSFSDVADVITWKGGKIAPGEYGDFKILAMGLPSDTDSLVFKAIQHYDDNQVVSWIETGADAEHPAPVVKLVAAGEGDAASTPTTAPATTKPATTTTAAKASDSSKGVATAALVIAIVGLLVAGGAIVMARKPSSA